jgi:endoglucanase
MGGAGGGGGAGMGGGKITDTDAGMRDSSAGVETGPAQDAAVGVALPLSTCGRWIVDKNLKRVKLAGVNWYGANDVNYVVGGLDKAPLTQIVNTIRDLGFNTVRLPFSNEMLYVTSSVANATVAANASLRGKKPLDVFDAVVDAITSAGLYVVLDNNSTHAQECCAYDQEALWYTSDHSEAAWIADWETMALRYVSNLRVIGADLRQEPRPFQGLLSTTFVNWGQGGTNDWAAAATRAGNRVLAKNPNLIVFIEGIDAADNLTGVKAHPIALQPPNKVSYEAHQFATFPPYPGDTSVSYGEMTAADLKTASKAQWGYILDPSQTFTAPVLLGQFGATTQSAWLANLETYMRELDMDFAFWVLNGGPTANGAAEPFAILADDWTTVKRDARLTALQAMQKATRGPGISANDTCTQK